MTIQTNLTMSVHLHQLHSFILLSLNVGVQLFYSYPYLLFGISQVIVTRSVVKQLQQKQILLDQQVYFIHQLPLLRLKGRYLRI
jgi:hypothetical protein